MDVAIAASVLCVTSPILMVVMVGTRFFLGPGVVFRQLRGGHGGTLFELLKFRSMLDQLGPDEIERTLDERAHPWGELLRRTSIDEIPGLWNILRGEMSIVGPRPLVAVYLDRYDEHQAGRHRLRPGLTGLAQISGRNLLDWEDKFALDNRYIDELSLRGDLRIIAQTLWHLLTPWRHRGTGHAPEFMGTPSPIGTTQNVSYE
jgi:lipopolysaccharide/colanic/teichoic acid biosynthesis glycosyltransferase